jgi:hypothetical protein
MKYIIASLLTAVFFALPTRVQAAEECTTTTGSYGQTSTTCKVLGETTTVTHETVDAGLGDISFWMIAQVLTLISVGGFGLAKLAERTYWFD